MQSLACSSPTPAKAGNLHQISEALQGWKPASMHEI